MGEVSPQRQLPGQPLGPRGSSFPALASGCGSFDGDARGRGWARGQGDTVLGIHKKPSWRMSLLADAGSELGPQEEG